VPSKNSLKQSIKHFRKILIYLPEQKRSLAGKVESGGSGQYSVGRTQWAVDGTLF
jgi:hypothetical protein